MTPDARFVTSPPTQGPGTVIGGSTPTAEPVVQKFSNTVLVVVCAGIVLASLDMFIVNVALPQIGRDFHGANLTHLSWVLNGYAIVYAALLVPAGRVADRTSRRLGFLIGLGVFTAMSAGCALATSLDLLIAFRVLQAAGAALLTPTSLSLVLTTSSPQRRGAALRTWAAMGGVAAAAGPVAGGFLVNFSWRWAFLINVPLGLAAIVVGVRSIPEAPIDEGKKIPDIVGSVLLVLGIGALVLGLVNGGDWGWGSAKVLVALTAGVVFMAAFAWRSGYSPNPVLPFDLLKVRTFAVSLGAVLLSSVAFGAMLVSLVLWIQYDWGWSPLKAGLAIAPGPLLVPVFAMLVAGRLIHRMGPGPVIALGSAAFAAGTVWWALAVGIHPEYVGSLLGGVLLTGVGVGLTLPTLIGTSVSALPSALFATGSGIVSMIRQVGYAMGTALVIGVVGTHTGHGTSVSHYVVAWYVIAGISVAAGICGLLLLKKSPGLDGAPSSETEQLDLRNAAL